MDASVDVVFVGLLILLKPVSVHLICDVSVSNFPFEQHTCDINITSNMLTMDMMNLHVAYDLGGADASAFSPNSEWGLVSFEGLQDTEVGRLHCPNCTYPLLTFRFVIRRRWKMKFFLYYLPNILLNIKTACQFLLPIESSERMKWASSTYLGTTFYLLTVRAVFSQSIELPAWVFYMALVTPLGGLAQLITIITLGCHFHGVHDNFRTLPNWARQLFLGQLASFVGLSPKQIPNDIRDIVMKGETDEVRLIDDEDVQPDDEGDNISESQIFLSQMKQRQTFAVLNVGETGAIARDLMKIGGTLKMNENQQNKFQMVLYKILKHCEIGQEMANEDIRVKVLRYEWKELANVVDRYSFVLYFVLTSIIWAYAFYIIPDYKDNIIV